MPERSPYLDIPDKCDGCPLVQAMASESRKRPLTVTERSADEMQRLFDVCPGYRRGLLGLLRTLRLQIREGFMYGGPVIDASTGREESRLTIVQPSGCGTMAREMIETFESIPVTRR
ncbi:hypothetical protein KC973_01905 [Candidatus Saccharibacteria bacterium]|nr:hypothetical protein [Candidatus Saccharibacteria bacterium]